MFRQITEVFLLNPIKRAGRAFLLLLPVVAPLLAALYDEYVFSDARTLTRAPIATWWVWGILLVGGFCIVWWSRLARPFKIFSVFLYVGSLLVMIMIMPNTVITNKEVINLEMRRAYYRNKRLYYEAQMMSNATSQEVFDALGPINTHALSIDIERLEREARSRGWK